jgi:hypothetical protein
MRSYIDAINKEITRKREEFAHAGLWVPKDTTDEPEMLYDPKNPTNN